SRRERPVTGFALALSRSEVIQMQHTQSETQSEGKLTLSSPVLGSSDPMPERFTADGDDASPPLTWEDPPAGTKSLAVVCEDLDAPKAPFRHWVAWNIPATSHELAPDAGRADMANGLRQGRNDAGTSG